MSSSVDTIFNEKNITDFFKIFALLGPLIGAGIGLLRYRNHRRRWGGLVTGTLWGSGTVILFLMWHLLEKISARFGIGNVKGLIIFVLIFLIVIVLWTFFSVIVQRVVNRPQGNR